MYLMDVEFQFHPWRFIIHPPKTKEEEEKEEVATADITLSDIITDMMEEEEDATRAQSCRDKE